MIDGYKVAGSDGGEKSREYGWSVGFGLQQADGLQPSEYAHDVARRQIAGRISYGQAAQEISEYHAANPSQKEHREADVVSQRISEILQMPTFAFSPGVLKAIHGKLFAGVLPDDWTGVWQIHPFREGNTRTAATFGILYLRFLGFDVNNEPFARHSQYFRDALALVNASDPAFKTAEPLQLFVKALLFDSSVQLKSLRADEPFAH